MIKENGKYLLDANSSAACIVTVTECGKQTAIVTDGHNTWQVQLNRLSPITAGILKDFSAMAVVKQNRLDKAKKDISFHYVNTDESGRRQYDYIKEKMRTDFEAGVDAVLANPGAFDLIKNQHDPEMLKAAATILKIANDQDSDNIQWNIVQGWAASLCTILGIRNELTTYADQVSKIAK